MYMYVSLTHTYTLIHVHTHTHTHTHTHQASDSIDADYLPTFSSLLQHYHTLHWFTSQPALTTNVSAL